MEIIKGNVSVVKKFIDAGSSRPAGMTEMQTFWKALTDTDKLQFTREALALMPELAPTV